MSPKMRKLYKTVNSRLKTSSWNSYRKFVIAVCQANPDAPSSSLMAGYFRSGDFDRALSLADSLSGTMYPDAWQHFQANQIAALVRKYPFPKGTVATDPEGEAKRKFWKAEHSCNRVNQRFRAYNKRSPYEHLLSRARGFIRYVIGDAPNLHEIVSKCNFGPGANVGVHGDATNAARKILSDRWSVTPGAVVTSYFALSSDHRLLEVMLRGSGDYYSVDPAKAMQYYRSKIDVIPNNKIVFVPKTARVHRTIAIEPLLNGFLQKGTDLAMRKRLARVGIDLEDQTVNQRFALSGSLDDSAAGFVTIDLSAASDSMATEVVRNLLPPEWFAFLNQLRSGTGELDGEQFTFNKFCSMGNGFCFPLETLIFASICHACGCSSAGTDFAVYGDDIIVQKSRSEAVISLLRVCGFRTNSDKTFLEGPFRESCGADYFRGIDVRPLTLKFELDSIESLFKLLNLSLRNSFTRDFFGPVRRDIISRIPEQFQFFRPYKGNEDSGIDSVGSEHLSSPHVRWNISQQCWKWKEFVHPAIEDPLPKTHDFYSSVLVRAALSGATGDKPFTYRRRTGTKVQNDVSHSGAHSTWTPRPCGGPSSSLRGLPAAVTALPRRP